MKNDITVLSQNLRKNMTKEERHLWYDFLKQLSVTVKRQEVFENYISDFYICEAKLIIELDGSHHYTEEGLEKDRSRDRYFQKHGIKVLRYTNLDIHNNFTGVCADILAQIETRRKEEKPVSLC